MILCGLEGMCGRGASWSLRQSLEESPWGPGAGGGWGNRGPGGRLEKCVVGRILGGRFHVRGEGGLSDEMLQLLDLQINPAGAGINGGEVSGRGQQP